MQETVMLLSKPHRWLDECMVSYLIRVGELNGFLSFVYMLKKVGFNWKNFRAPTHQILSGQYPIEKYLKLLGLGYTPPDTAEVYKKFARSIDTPYIFARSPKVCQKCISEMGYCRSAWSYLPVIACPKHKVMLTDFSSETGKRLSWFRSHLDRYSGEKNDFIISNVLAPSSAIQLSDLFIKLSKEKFLYNKKYPFVVHGLNFCEALSLLNFITHYLYILNSQDRFRPVSFDNIFLSKYYLDAWDILKNWPDGFFQMLSQYIDHPMSNRGQSGINKHFRDIHQRLYLQSANKGIARIKIEFDRYIETYWPEALDATRLVRIKIHSDTRDLISKNDAARFFNCHTSKIDNLIKFEKIKTTVFKGKAFYSRNEIGGALSFERDNWTFSQFCQELQLSRHQSIILLRSGLFKILQSPDAEHRDWLIDKLHAQLVVNSLCVNALSNTFIGITLAGVQHQGFDIEKVIRGMLEGSLEFNCFRDKEKLYSFKQFSNFRFIKKEE